MALAPHKKDDAVRTFADMYRSRAVAAVKHNRRCEDDPRCVVTRLPVASPAVVPDMQVQLWSRADIAAKCDVEKVGTRIALQDMIECGPDECTIGIAFDDGDLVTVRVALVGR